MKITAILGVALPLAAIVLVGPTQSQQLQTGVAYSPGKSFDQLSWSAFVAAVKPAPQPAPAGNRRRPAAASTPRGAAGEAPR